MLVRMVKGFSVRATRAAPRPVPYNMLMRRITMSYLRGGYVVRNTRQARTTQSATNRKVSNTNSSKEAGGKGAVTTALSKKEIERYRKTRNVRNVPPNMKHLLEKMNGAWVGAYDRETGFTVVKVGNKVFKEVPPPVTTQGTKVILKWRNYEDIAKQYASMTNNGKVMILFTVGNFAYPYVWVDKNGKIQVPDYWKKYIHINPDGTISIDTKQLIRDFAPKYKGKQVRVQISVRGKINGIVGGIAGTSTQVNLS